MIYGLIFSAGKETRFDDEYPKCFSLFNGTSFLDRNISSLNNICDKVLVVTSVDNEQFFKEYEHISIESGNGCGDAVLKALQQLSLSEDDYCFIQWGDCLCRSIEDIYKTYFLMELNCIVIPCSWEKNPYVTLYEEDNKISVFFSKYGETNEEGFHDSGTFFGKAKYIREKLIEFQSKIIIGDKYVHKHDDEMQFLDLFNETDAKGLIFPTKLKTISFNTKEELKNL